jgi:hypothetical protein
VTHHADEQILASQDLQLVRPSPSCRSSKAQAVHLGLAECRPYGALAAEIGSLLLHGANLNFPMRVQNRGHAVVSAKAARGAAKIHELSYQIPIRVVSSAQTFVNSAIATLSVIWKMDLCFAAASATWTRSFSTDVRTVLPNSVCSALSIAAR